ncbi:MAG: VWA domain-containing protein [Anaerolineae bacterium]
MGFLLPSALALSVLALPIIIFYMLKLRRQPVRVSSLLLWQQVLQDRQANAPWQRLRRNLLLLLQLLILALLVLALARPYLTVQARVQGNVVLLLDASASMQATDASPTRFAAARQAALELIDRLGPNDAVTLIAVGRAPRILASATTDRDALRRALDSARPGNGPVDWEAALTLAAANAATLPDSTVAVLSDGAFSSEDLPSPPVPVEFITVGEGRDNQGLVALALRDGPAGPELFLRAANAAPQPARRRVEIRVDGQLFDARQLDIPARGSAGLVLSDLPLAARMVEARLAGGDALPVDDRAWAVRQAAPASVLLVGEDNLFLERALALLPDVNPRRAAPDQPLPQSPFDLTIFDRALPAAPGDSAQVPLPDGNLLFIAPPASTGLFQVNGVFTQTRLVRVEADHPLLAYVSLDNLHVARAQAVQPPAWGQTLVEAEGGPLLVAGQVGGRRVAVLSFDLHQSDLPLQIDFPILIVNLARWLLPGGGLTPGQSLQPGQGFELPAAPSASALRVETPSGRQLELPLDSTEEAPAIFGQTFEPGIYRVFAGEAGQADPAFLTAFAVNLLDEGETNIQPGRARIAAGDPAGGAGAVTGRQEWWWPVLLLGLGLLLVEWWVYWRGMVR